jgi:hypothetical protein
MVFRQHLVIKHQLAEEALTLPPTPQILHADALAAAGNWFGAAEAYSHAEAALSHTTSTIDRARIRARSATYFDIAGRHHSAARAYSQTADLLSDIPDHYCSSGELYNRSAHCYRLAGAHFSAGTAWMSAARSFAKLGTNDIRSRDNIPPVPWSAMGLTAAGICFNAAGEAFLGTNDEKKWATHAFWLAGNLHAQTFGGGNIQSAWSYRAALENGIREYGSVSQEYTAKYLPLSEEERSAKIDPIKIIEGAFYKTHFSHYKLNNAPHAEFSARVDTEKDLAEMFHSFSIIHTQCGHGDGARHFRIRTQQTRENLYLRRRHYTRWITSWLWRVTSNYGESPLRWFACTSFVITFFALSFYLTESAAPTSSLFDNFYFSIVTFTSLGYGDIQPVGVFGRLLASLEVAAGLVFFGILLSFLTNRIGRP